MCAVYNINLFFTMHNAQFKQKKQTDAKTKKITTTTTAAAPPEEEQKQNIYEIYQPQDRFRYTRLQVLNLLSCMSVTCFSTVHGLWQKQP